MELGQVENVKLRSVWPREDRDFSVWLAANIGLLNERLPFEIDPESLEQEGSAGDFRVDIVGDAVSHVTGEPIKVVVENQLERTDHSHLGQVLTYVAAYDAKAAVWIASEIRPEHAKAVQWLNDESQIDAWLFQIEVIQIGDSAKAPLLRQIIGPSELSLRAKSDRRDTETKRAAMKDFWTDVLPVVQEASSPMGVFVGRSPKGNPYESQKADGPANAHWQVWATSTGTWACLRIHGEDKAESLWYYDQLKAHAATVEESFGGSLVWDPLPNASGCLIRWDNLKPGGYKHDREERRRAAVALGDGFVRLIKALRSRTASLAPYVPEDVLDD